MSTASWLLKSFLRVAHQKANILLAGIVWFPFVIGGASSTPLPVPVTGKVAVYGPNHHYLQDAKGNPFVLIGDGNESWNYGSTLDQMKGKINYQRAYAAWWDRTAPQNSPSFGSIPFPLTGGKADLNAVRAQHWTWLRQYLQAAQDRGIVVGLTIWDGHTELPGGKASGDAVWHSQYNLQGVEWEYNTSALDSPNASGSNAQRAAYYQRKFVDTLVGVVKGYSNVILELDNETGTAPVSWWQWWARYLKSKWGGVVATTWNNTGTVPDSVFHADANFHMKSYHNNTSADISATTYGYGKVVVADADNHCEESDAGFARRQAWQSFLRGGNWNDFVCGGNSFPSPAKMGYYSNLLAFIKTTQLPFYQMKPSFSSYKLTQEGAHYLAYLPYGGSTSMSLSGQSGNFVSQWYNPRTGQFSSAGTQSGGTSRTYSAPDGNDWVLYVHR